jgi:hypothetical protein
MAERARLTQANKVQMNLMEQQKKKAALAAEAKSDLLLKVRGYAAAIAYSAVLLRCD